MVTKRTLDRVGGIASILVGVGCAWIGYGAWRVQHNVWKVFAALCVVLVLNGIAMIRYSRRKNLNRTVDDLKTPGGIVAGSSRV